MSSQHLSSKKEYSWYPVLLLAYRLEDAFLKSSKDFIS